MHCTKREIHQGQSGISYEILLNFANCNMNITLCVYTYIGEGISSSGIVIDLCCMNSEEPFCDEENIT